jgi:hypothetical protein
MRFLTRIMRSVAVASRAHQDRRFAHRHRSWIDLETLEGRALMSGINGVSLTPTGTLTINPAHNSGGNSAVVSIDPKNNEVKVTVNFGSGSQTEEFNPTVTPIYNVLYNGGALGGDTFTDDTSLISREYGYGSGNHFTGGTNINYVWFMNGTGNTYNAVGNDSVSDVWEFGGIGSDTIKNPDGGTLQLYTYV